MITRDNYEEFFLLYVDNELSAAERIAVEKFAAGDPGLGDELRALLQCRLKPESNLFFSNSASLLKRELPQDSIKELAAHEETLLSYIDGELDESGRNSIEDLARRNPSLLRELELLRQTVSTPDPLIVFENKEVLYRRPSRIRIIGLPPAFFRVAAAAAIILAVGLLIFSRTGRNTRPDKNDHLAVTPATPGTLHSSTGQQKGTAQHQEIARQEKAGKEGTTGQPGTPAEDKGQRSPALLVKTTAPGPAGEGSEAPRRTMSPGNARPADLLAKNGPETGNIGAPDQGSKENPVNSSLASLAMASTGDRQPENKELSSFATQALLKEVAASGAEDEDDILEQPSPKKNKLRGFFRKVSRVFEKTAGSEDPDNKHGVLIGNFQVALK